MIKIIAAMGLDRSMGLRHEAGLPWTQEHSTPEDLKRFYEMTRGGTVIMGRRTWESLPAGPLADRVNVVVSRKAFKRSFQAESVKEAIDMAPTENIFLIGGEKIFKQGQRFATIIDVTLIPFKGYEHHDTSELIYFPEIDKKFKRRCSFTHPYTDKLRILQYRR